MDPSSDDNSGDVEMNEVPVYLPEQGGNEGDTILNFLESVFGDLDGISKTDNDIGDGDGEQKDENNEYEESRPESGPNSSDQSEKLTYEEVIDSDDDIGSGLDSTRPPTAFSADGSARDGEEMQDTQAFPKSPENLHGNDIERKYSGVDQPTEEAGWWPTYIQAYLKLANYSGFAPFRYSKENERQTFGNQIPFATVASLAAISTLALLKKSIMEAIAYAGTTKIAYYIVLWRNTALALFRFTLLYTLSRRGKDVSRMIDLIDKSAYKETAHKKSKCKFAATLFLTSLLIAALYTFPAPHGEEEKKYDLGYSLEYRSREIHSLFLATSVQKNGNILYVNQTGEINAFTGIFGTIGFASRFSGFLVENVGRDFLILTGLMLKDAVDAFQFDSQPPAIPVSIFAVPHAASSQVLANYNELTKISKSLNDIIETLVKVILSENILRTTMVMDYVMNPVVSGMTKGLMILEMTKTVMFIYIALSISNRIRKFKEWLFVELKEGRLGINAADAQLILEEVMTPIGIGRDVFYVNLALMMSSVGITFAYFMSTVETRRDC